MNQQQIQKRIADLLASGTGTQGKGIAGHEIFQGALSLMSLDKLQDVLTELKNNQLLQGTQVGIANSYLNFRNSSLHAQWERVDRESIASVLAFVEQLLLKHFS